MDKRNPLKKSGRPKIILDDALVLQLVEAEGLGWMKASEKYRERTGVWVSRDSLKRRYLEAKAAKRSHSDNSIESKVKIKSPLERIAEEWERKLKEL